MGAGHQFEIGAMRDSKKPLHPAWVAVGCFTLVGLITAGYLLGDWFIKADQQKGWIALPPEYAVPASNPFLILKLAFALVVLLIGFALFSILYGIIRPPKPGKYDVTDSTLFPPPPRRRKH
jgi:hypothetical protein